MSIARLRWSIFLISYCLPSDYMRAFFPLPVLKVFAFSTIKIPIITRSILELSCLLAKAMNYLHQSWEVGGSRHNHGHSIRMQKDSLRRQHALNGGFIPSKAEHINRELEGGKSIDPTSSQLQSREPNHFCQEPSAHPQAAETGKERKSASATLNAKVFFPDKEGTRQLQGRSYQNGRSYFGNSSPNMTNQILFINLVLRQREMEWQGTGRG